MHGRGCSHDMGAGRNFWVSGPMARLPPAGGNGSSGNNRAAEDAGPVWQ